MVTVSSGCDVLIPSHFPLMTGRLQNDNMSKRGDDYRFDCVGSTVYAWAMYVMRILYDLHQSIRYRPGGVIYE